MRYFVRTYALSPQDLAMLIPLTRQLRVMELLPHRNLYF